MKKYQPPSGPPITTMPAWLVAPKIVRRHEVLPLAVRKVLHERRLMSIRQSAYAAGRECPHKLALMPTATTDQSGLHALCGSVFHALLSDPLQAKERASDEGYYQEVFRLIRTVNPTTVWSYKGRPVDLHLVKQLCLKFSTMETIGVRLGDLAARSYSELGSRGFHIVAQEEPLVYEDGSPYPVSHTGTLDLRCEYAGSIAIGDCKSSGLWDAYFEEGGSIKAQSHSPMDIQYHSQLRHYNWLRYLLTGEVATWQFILNPVNLVPYKDIKRAKERRGLPLFLAPSMGLDGIKSYEQDYRDFFKMWTVATPYRAYPTNWGAISCPSCPYFRPCQGDLKSSGQASLLDSSELDYLRQ